MATTTRKPQAKKPQQPTGQPTSSKWPVKGYDGEQLWQQDEPNVELVGGYPILTSGSAHAAVVDLGLRLGRLGYENSVTRGENPYGQVDSSIMAAVGEFRRDYGVVEDHRGFTPPEPDFAARHIGPWTSTAIVRASDREDA